MHKRHLLNIIILLTLLIGIGVNLYSREKESTIAFTEGELRIVMPEGDLFEKKEEPFLYYKVYKKNRLIGYCFNTRDIVYDERGYGGPMDILVGLDKNCDIKNIMILHHNETPKYASGITSPDFLDQFKGKGPKDKFIVGDDVDVVTQATISSRAVATILKSSVNRLQRVTDRFKEERRREASLNLNPNFYITVLIITFLLIAFYLKITWLRYTGLAISIIYFGFIKANFISMSNLGSIFLWNLPGLKSNLDWFIFIFSGLILTFLLGGFYCSYICPFGGLQRFLNRLLKFNIEITPALAYRLRKIRYILLWILTIFVLGLNNPNVVNYEPFSTIFLRRGSLVAWSIALIILVLSLFHYRPFCNYFCAAGAFLDILSNVGKRIFRRR